MNQNNFPEVQIFPMDKNVQLRQFSDSSSIVHKQSDSDKNLSIVSKNQQVTNIFRNQEEMELTQQIQNNQIDLEEVYLHEHNSSKIENQKIINLAQFQERKLKHFKSSWNWLYFFEFLFYHLIYFIILGPFSNIIFFKKPGMILMKNLKFWNFDVNFLSQTLTWAFSITGCSLYVMQNNSTITLTEILLVYLALVQRCIVMAAKYATFSEDHIQIYRTVLIPQEVFQSDLALFHWRTQTPQMIFIQTYHSLRRHEYEQKLFKLSFIVEPSNETLEQINETKIEYLVRYKDSDDLCKYKPIGKSCQIFCGYKIMGFMIEQFKKEISQKQMFIIVILQSLILPLTPIFYRYAYSSPGAIDIFRIIVNFINSFFAFSGSYIFLYIAIYDFQRKDYLLQQCYYMLQTRQNSLGYKKILPTISLHNPDTVQAWSMLRSVCHDYGQQYNLRSQGFYSLVFLGCLVLFIIGLALILELVKFELFELIILGEISIILLIYLTIFLFFGALLNSKFDEFEAALEDIKTTYQNINNFKVQYFQQGLEPENKLHRKFVQNIQNFVSDNNFEQIEQYLDTLIQSLKDNIKCLQYDRRNNPFKLYGVTVTFNLLKSIGVGISTIVGFAIQQRFAKFKK